MRISPKQMKKRTFSYSFLDPLLTTRRTKTRSFVLKMRPRRERCAASRGSAVRPPALSRLRPRPDGSAAGAGGARAAGSPAAAPGGLQRPALGLPRVALALPEVRRTPRHAPTRPVGLCDGARRGGGAARPGEGRLVHQGALCLAAAAVPRLAGTVPLRGGTRRSGCAHMVASQFYSSHFCHLIVVNYSLFGR